LDARFLGRDLKFDSLHLEWPLEEEGSPVAGSAL